MILRLSVVLTVRLGSTGQAVDSTDAAELVMYHGQAVDSTDAVELVMYHGQAVDSTDAVDSFALMEECISINFPNSAHNTWCYGSQFVIRLTVCNTAHWG